MSHELSAGRSFRVMTLALTLVLASASPQAGLAQAGHRPGFPGDVELEQMLKFLVDDGETPGIVLGILDADGGTRVVSRGSAGPEARPLGRRSIFELGSINKAFTGALLAVMVSTGEVALEDPVATYLPDSVRVPSRQDRDITLLDLATHTSGLPSIPDNYRPVDPRNPWADYTVEHLYDFLSNYELTRSPGEEAEYSNVGMGLLGHALARAAGQPYRRLLGERILEPLGMDDTGFTLSGPNAEWLTQGHQAGEIVPHYTGTAAIDGAGGLLSNAEDMLRFLGANVGPPTTELERVLRNAHRARRPFEDGRDMGLGWRIDYQEGRALLGHGGTTGGYRTYIGLDPSNGIGFVLLTNTGRFDDDIGRDFLRYGQPLDLPVVDVPPAVLAPYAGEYAYREDRSIFVRLEDEGYLTLQVPGDPRIRLYSESETSFFAKRHPWRITFDVTEAREVLRITSEHLDRAVSGPKVGSDVPPPRTVAGN